MRCVKQHAHVYLAVRRSHSFTPHDTALVRKRSYAPGGWPMNFDPYPREVCREEATLVTVVHLAPPPTASCAPTHLTRRGPPCSVQWYVQGGHALQTEWPLSFLHSCQTAQCSCSTQLPTLCLRHESRLCINSLCVCAPGGQWTHVHLP